MRKAMLVLLGVGLAGCTVAAQPPDAPSPQGQAWLARMLAGKAAGPLQRCIPSTGNQDVQVIDSTTIAYRQGTTIYVNHPQRPCNGLGSGYTLMTRSTGMTCENDIAEVVDSSGMTVGSCFLGPFIAYNPAR